MTDDDQEESAALRPGMGEDTATEDHLYSAPELARDLGITPRALRFYESKGLLQPRRVGTRRAYDRRDRGRLLLILRGKRLGFSLATIREYLELYDADAGQMSQLSMLHGKVSARIEELELQRQALEETLRELKVIERETATRLEEGSSTGGPVSTDTDTWTPR